MAAIRHPGETDDAMQARWRREAGALEAEINDLSWDLKTCPFEIVDERRRLRARIERVDAQLGTYCCV